QRRWHRIVPHRAREPHRHRTRHRVLRESRLSQLHSRQLRARVDTDGRACARQARSTHARALEDIAKLLSTCPTCRPTRRLDEVWDARVAGTGTIWRTRSLLRRTRYKLACATFARA